MQQLSEDAIKKVSGPSWVPLKQTFLDLSEALLSIDSTAIGELTTIYVKYLVPTSTEKKVYAVAWLKTSKSITVGLALPEDFEATELVSPPAGMKYPGLNRYLIILPGIALPDGLPRWAKIAHDSVLVTK